MDKDIVKQIALDVFGTKDGIRPQFPRTGEKIQEAMELSFKAGADAAMELLKKEPDSHYIVNYGGKGSQEHPNGWLVFIPDEEDK